MSDHTGAAAVESTPRPDRLRRAPSVLVATAVAGGVMLSGPVAMAAPKKQEPKKAKKKTRK